MLVLPAAFRSASNRPSIRSGQRTTGSHTLVLRVLRTDEAGQRNSFRKVQCIHREETMDPRFAAIEGDPIKTVACAAPVCAKNPVQPECRTGCGLRIGQLRSRRNVGEMLNHRMTR